MTTSTSTSTSTSSSSSSARAVFSTLKQLLETEDKEGFINFINDALIIFDYRYRYIMHVIDITSLNNGKYGFLNLRCVVPLEEGERNLHVIEFTLTKSRIRLLESEDKMGWSIDDMTVDDVILDLIDDNDLSH